MRRRGFLRSCAMIGGSVGVPDWVAQAWASTPARRYARAQLVDERGAPVRGRDLEVGRNYVFDYPFLSTPCFLLDLGRSLAPDPGLRDEGGAAYTWPGGVGPRRSIVAYSAICAHKLAYPTRDITFIRYQAADSPRSRGNVIHCCADHSVYDPYAGARVVSGPARQPLAAIVLENDPRTDALFATGTVGPEQFEAFFRKYDFKLAMEYGQARARQEVRERSMVRPLSVYCRQTVQC